METQIEYRIPEGRAQAQARPQVCARGAAPGPSNSPRAAPGPRPDRISNLKDILSRRCPLPRASVLPLRAPAVGKCKWIPA